jgi:hypothetical protein
MRDPLANHSDDPYTVLGVSQDCTPEAAERAMDAFLGRTHGRENAALDACDTLRHPSRRLAIDIFRYPEGERATEFDLPAGEELARLVERIAKTIGGMAAGRKWDRVMPILPVDEVLPREPGPPNPG